MERVGGVKTKGESGAVEKAAPSVRSPGRAPAPQTPDYAQLDRYLKTGVIRAKLTVSQPGDPDEREADAMADAFIQRTVDGGGRAAGSAPPCSCGGTCAACAGKISRKPSSQHPTPNTQHPVPSLGSGSPLPASVRAYFEPHFGQDFSSVRVHTGPEAHSAAESFGARAFAYDGSIAFRDGEYAPESDAGRHLLAHELTHIVQQGNVASRKEEVQREEAATTPAPANGAAASGEEPSLLDRAKGAVGGLFQRGADAVSGAVQGVSEFAAGLYEKARQFSQLFSVIQKAVENPGPIKAELEAKVGAMIAHAPAQASSVALEQFGAFPEGGQPIAVSDLDFAADAPQMDNQPDVVIQRAPQPGEEHAARRRVLQNLAKGDYLSVVGHYLGEGGSYLAQNWLSVIGGLLFDLVFPLPSILKHLWEGMQSNGKMFAYLLSGQFSEATNEGLKSAQAANAILGLIYVPLMLGLSIAGAIVGTPVVGAAVLGFLHTVGYALLAAFAATEAAIIGKGIYDLTQTPTLPEADASCKRIAESSVTVGLTIVLVALGAIAAWIAEQLGPVIARALRASPTGRNLLASLLRAQRGFRRAAGIKRGGGNARPTVRPAEETIREEGPSKDGRRQLQITEEGICKVCASPCDEVRIRYEEELKAAPELGKEVNRVEKMADAEEQMTALREVEQDLAGRRTATRTAETPVIKLTRMTALRQRTEAVMERLTTLMEEARTKGLGGNAKYQKLLRDAESQKTGMNTEWSSLEKDAKAIEGDSQLQVSDLIDEARDGLDDLRTRAESLEKRIHDDIPELHPLRRVFLDPEGTKHMPASQYKKHVQGNAAQRQEKAVSTDNGQYKGSLTDADITALERRALLEGEVISPDFSGGKLSFCEVYFEFGEEVGFAGGTGAATKSVRVEWSSGTVHSHPR